MHLVSAAASPVIRQTRHKGGEAHKSVQSSHVSE